MRDLTKHNCGDWPPVEVLQEIVQVEYVVDLCPSCRSIDICATRPLQATPSSESQSRNATLMSPDKTRPLEPDPDILQEADRSLRRLNGESSTSRRSWEVGHRIDRKSSSLFPLRLRGSGSVDAYYKQALITSGGTHEISARILEAERTGLGRRQEVEERFAASLVDEGISFSQTLAVDPVRLISVTKAVPGRPFGRPLSHIAPPGRRRRALALIERVGRAARLIESSQGPWEDSDEHLDAARVEYRLRMIEPALDPRMYANLTETLDQLYEEIKVSDVPIALAHGDLSSSNLLVDDGLGLIDFSWIPRVRGYDVANFAFRLEFHDLIPVHMKASLRESLLTGYGDPLLEQSPHWRYLRLAALLKKVHSGGGAKGKKRLLMQRALAEIGHHTTPR